MIQVNFKFGSIALQKVFVYLEHGYMTLCAYILYTLNHPQMGEHTPFERWTAMRATFFCIQVPSFNMKKYKTKWPNLHCICPFQNMHIQKTSLAIVPQKWQPIVVLRNFFPQNEPKKI